MTEFVRGQIKRDQHMAAIAFTPQLSKFIETVDDAYCRLRNRGQFDGPIFVTALYLGPKLEYLSHFNWLNFVGRDANVGFVIQFNPGLRCHALHLMRAADVATVVAAQSYEFDCETATTVQQAWRRAVVGVMETARAGDTYEALHKRMTEDGADPGYATYFLTGLGVLPKPAKPGRSSKVLATPTRLLEQAARLGPAKPTRNKRS